MTKDPIARVSGHAALCIVDFCAGIEQEDDASELMTPYTDAVLTQLLGMLQTQARYLGENTEWEARGG
jgi:hypothetical protein